MNKDVLNIHGVCKRHKFSDFRLYWEVRLLFEWIKGIFVLFSINEKMNYGSNEFSFDFWGWLSKCNIGVLIIGLKVNIGWKLVHCLMLNFILIPLRNSVIALIQSSAWVMKAQRCIFFQGDCLLKIMPSQVICNVFNPEFIEYFKSLK